jgi:hypothetical protein
MRQAKPSKGGGKGKGKDGKDGKDGKGKSKDGKGKRKDGEGKGKGGKDRGKESAEWSESLGKNVGDGRSNRNFSVVFALVLLISYRSTQFTSDFEFVPRPAPKGKKGYGYKGGVKSVDMTRNVLPLNISFRIIQKYAK